ncbi:MAG: heat-shock protein Hsp20 [Desulfobulbus propionicus]|nr:MAG: heat-shock protein Hsp20 [Desulfobulbus propionicus]
MWNRMHAYTNFFEPVDFFRSQLDQMLGAAHRLHGCSLGSQTADRYPRTNIFDSGEALQIAAELPGLRKEDLSITIQDNHLEIQGHTAADRPEGYTLHHAERGQKNFCRSFTLPCEVDAETSTASLEDGLLKLVLPKAEASRARQITIN